MFNIVAGVTRPQEENKMECRFCGDKKEKKKASYGLLCTACNRITEVKSTSVEIQNKAIGMNRGK